MTTDARTVTRHLILIVDDERLFREAYREILQDAGFDTELIPDGAAAITRFKELQPDLVLLDLIMPGLDGFATCQQIRALPGGLYTPILMITGREDPESISTAFDAGATDFISKPVQPELLVFRIRYMLRASRSIRDLAESEARLAAAQQIARLGNWELDRSTGEFLGSHETFRILGLGKVSGCISRESVLALVHPRDRDRAASKLTGNEPAGFDFECRVIRPDGEVRIVHLQGESATSVTGRAGRLIGTIHDITEKKRSEERLLLLREAVDCLPLGLTITDVNGRIIYTNPAEARMHGRTAEELLGGEARDFGPQYLRNPSPGRWLSASGAWRRESVNVTSTGEEFPVELLSVAVRTTEGGCLGVVTTCEDITQRKEAEEKIHSLAYYDSLTGLPNRGTFLERLHQALTLAQRHGHQVGLLFLDLDSFKDVNDTQGHDFGDRLLRAVSSRIGGVMRESDTLARFGGDEFVIVLPSLESRESAAAAAERILSVFATPFELDGQLLYTSASTGIAIYPDDADDADDLFKCADTAMYHAKSEARGCYRFFSMELNRLIVRRVALENGLRRGLENSEFFLHYQPQWDLHSGSMVGVEALVRWRNPDFGVLQPAEFIPLVEKTGLILPLGEWVLRTASLQARNWNRTGQQPLRVAVNISGRQFRQADFLEMIERVTRETGVDPAVLEFEFTESVIMEKADRTIRVLKALKEMGIHLSIDDFGTGYSSLSYLKYFPIDRIKIDRSFIADIKRSPDDAAIVDAIISLCRSLNLKVMAEGVETVEQMHFLTARNCSEVQGFLLAHPMEAAEIGRQRMCGCRSAGEALQAEETEHREGCPQRAGRRL